MAGSSSTNRADAAIQVAVDDTGVTLSGRVAGSLTYDLLINDQHLWSLTPARDMEQQAGAYWAGWPAALRRYLNGYGAVAIREHVSGESVATSEQTFGAGGSEPISVRDTQGHPLLLDKWGKLIRPLADESQEDSSFLLDAVEKLLDALRDTCGVPAFICFGTLLGAVRDQDLIGHDNDIDIAYLSLHRDPVDITREAYRVERLLRAEGWTIRRGSSVRINVRLSMPNGKMRFVDVFSFGWVDDLLYMPSDVAVPAVMTTMLPLTTVQLRGRSFPAPADPEALLALTYGPSWGVPDPSFRYVTPRSLRHRFDGWYGGLHHGRKYWDSFAANSTFRIPSEPSAFAEWVEEHHESDRLLVDVGCGTGRDALWFARAGRHVLGLDFVLNWVHSATKAAAAREIPAEFTSFNLADVREVLTLGATLARREEPPDIYSRLLLSSISDQTRGNLWRLCQMSLRRGGLLFLEYRIIGDAKRPHAFAPDKPKRRFLRIKQVVAEIEAAGGTVLERYSGAGLAPFEDEDPLMSRLVVSWTLPASASASSSPASRDAETAYDATSDRTRERHETT